MPTGRPTVIAASAAVGLLLVLTPACKPFAPASPGPLFDLPVYGEAATMQGGPNPVFVPVVDKDFAWEQIVDVVDDYFRVDRERRVELVGSVITEGSITTFPRVGATLLEPHRRDSVGRFNRWESTLQTIRRSAKVRVIPDQGGYLVSAVVHKELEDLARPEQAVGVASFRNDNALTPRTGRDVDPLRDSGIWIPLGRDTALEQRILAEIQQRASGG